MGDRDALDALTSIVYPELRRIAEGYMRRERGGHTLQPTALVNEAWMRLAKQGRTSFDNRTRFFALAAQIMRQILVDYARNVGSEKRGGGAQRMPLDAGMAAGTSGTDEFLALDEALSRLAGVSSRQAKVIEMRYFGGLKTEEIADLMGVSAATISNDQKTAQAWLSHAMSSPGGIR